MQLRSPRDIPRRRQKKGLLVMSDAQSPGSVPWVDLTDSHGQVPHYGDSRVIS